MNTPEPEQPTVSEHGKRDRKFLGPLIVLSMALLSIVFTAGESFSGAIGYTAAKLFTSIAFALPIFIVVIYVSRYGQQLEDAAALNLFCYLLVACWVIQILLGMLIPIYLHRLSHDIDAEEAARYGLSVQEYRQRIECANVVCKNGTFIDYNCTQQVLTGRR